ncbi:hypothetical protein F5J12DRAFT_895665 [Pisolithus orientalis]|uniref:uncharacterized protein n=1 Tax=Pisolithus orientalis TaxID=936130 RepID=UPI00222579E8|nr:uncharacterized protein F5J12DRAFT_895665 [Pisolithus orientalis]KAI5997806.1 hypothetical protein F5J12DRAFT_895665 [Pisolithus orientalis]
MGQDFWSAMDYLLAKDLEWNGKDLKNKKWHEFFNKIITQDQEQYGKNAGTLLPPLLSMYTESFWATPTTPLPVPHTFHTLYHAPLCVVLYSSLDHLSGPDSTGNLLGKDF